MSIYAAQLQTFNLAGSGAVIGATSITLKSFRTIDGTQLTMGSFGDKGYMTMDAGNNTQEEQISFTGITLNSNGTSTLTGIKHVDFVTPFAETSGLQKTHAGSAEVIVSNTSGFYNSFLSGTTGTVTSVSVTTANGVSGTVATATTTPAITLALGDITPTSVNGTTSTEIGYVSGVTSAIQTQLNAKGVGTVTSASVVSANGFAGSVATATTTPAITLSTTINAPVIAGNGTAISAATTTGSGSTVVLSGSPTITLPNIAAVNVSGGIVSFPTGATDTLVSKNSTDILTNKTYDTAGTGNVLKINGTQVSAVTGTGAVVLATSPALVTPILGTPASGTVTNLTGTASININGTVGATTPNTGAFTTITGTSTLTLGVNATTIGKVKMFGNTSGDVTIQPTAAAGTATVQTLPATTGTLVNRVTTAAGVSASNTDGALSFTLGAITPTTVNGNTLTTGTYTLTGGAGKTLTFNNSITLAGTDSTTMTFPTTSATIARTDAAQTFTGIQTIPQVLSVDNAIAASANAATVTRSNRNNVVTNNSAAGLTITLSTTGATGGDMIIVQSLPSSAVAQTITWVNTENSDVTPSANLNASTTSPRTDGFKWNPLTSKWRCLASC
jgi:hypothetical protein